MSTLLLTICLTFLLIVLRNIFSFFLLTDSYDNKKKRRRQLEFTAGSVKSSTESKKELIEKMTNPFITYLPGKIKNYNQLESMLNMSGLTKYMNVKQYLIINYLSKILGILVFLLLYKSSLAKALVGALLSSFSFPFLIKNEAEENRKKLLSQFPRIIRYITSFLRADLPLLDSLKETLPYCNDIWKPYIQNLISDCQLYSTKEAILKFTSSIDIFEIKDFMHMILLGIEQGIDLKTTFDSQKDRTLNLHRQSMLMKINSRERLATLLQAPLILCVVAVFGLPVADQLVNTFFNQF